jgi:hypothetical protein
MSERAQKVMNSIWESRNSGGADTENKLISSAIRIISESIVYYSAQDGRIVLDKNDFLNLASEIESLES